MAIDPIAARVAVRYLLAKATLLSPDFKNALAAFHTGDVAPMVALIQRAIELSTPGGKAPQWFYALGTAKKNAIRWLYTEGHKLVEELRALGPSWANPTSPDSVFSRFPNSTDQALKHKEHFARERLEPWGKKLRTFEIALQSEDTEKHIKHGAFTIVRIAGLTQADVDGALEALDAASDKIRPKFPQVLYGTVFLSPHLSTKTAASYVGANDTVQLSVFARKRFSDMQTLIHEFGHRFDAKFFRNDELRKRFWHLSTHKIMETIEYDDKLRRAVAEEVLQFAQARKSGETMPRMSVDLERWIRSPLGVGPYVKTIISNFLAGKIDGHKLVAEVMGPMNRTIETDKVLHAPLHVTPYGGTKPSENFAEAFAFYVLGLSMPPALAEILAQL